MLEYIKYQLLLLIYMIVRCSAYFKLSYYLYCDVSIKCDYWMLFYCCLCELLLWCGFWSIVVEHTRATLELLRNSSLDTRS